VPRMTVSIASNSLTSVKRFAKPRSYLDKIGFAGKFGILAYCAEQKIFEIHLGACTVS